MTETVSGITPNIIWNKIATLLSEHPDGLTRFEIEKALDGKLGSLLSYHKKQGRLRTLGKEGGPQLWFLVSDLLAYITANPGKSSFEIEQALGEDVSARLGVLKAQGKIFSRKLDRNRYYPGQPEEEPKTLPAWFGPTLNDVPHEPATVDPPLAPEPIAEETTTERPMVGKLVNREVCGDQFEIEMVNTKTRHYYCANHIRHPDPVPTSTPTFPTRYLEELAKEFYWETGKDELRAFIEWHRGKSG
jgi:hypothetical protein